MMRKILLILLLFESTVINAQIWNTFDELGDHFENLAIQQPDDYEGKVTCTLIHRKGSNSKVAVLYVHGFSDYFFQAEMANQFDSMNYAFYALDLRKCGRSYLPHQKINNVRDLHEYFADIDTSLRLMKQQGMEKIVLIGHSMGGLIVSLYASEHIGNEMFDCVYLNSPFFDMNLNPFLEKCIFPLAAFRGKKKPNQLMQGGVSKAYGMSIYYREKGNWKYNLNWKPLIAPAVNLGWLNAIYRGQKQLQHGIKVAKPTLIMHSNQSVYGKNWNEKFSISDAVLDVNDIAKYSKKIEGNVTVVAIQHGMHDLILSQIGVRQSVYNQLFDWLSLQL